MLKKKLCLGSSKKLFFLWRKYEGLPFQHPITPPLTKLRLFDSYTFYTTLYVILNFDSKSVCEAPLHKVHAALFTCTSSWGVILNVIPRLDASSFIRISKMFISRRGCPTYIISDGGRDFESIETQEFVNRLGIEWKFKLPLPTWREGFFERLVKSTKILLRMELGNLKLNYERLQTLLLEIESP